MCLKKLVIKELDYLTLPRILISYECLNKEKLLSYPEKYRRLVRKLNYLKFSMLVNLTSHLVLVWLVNSLRLYALNIEERLKGFYAIARILHKKSLINHDHHHPEIGVHNYRFGKFFHIAANLFFHERINIKE